MKYLCKKKKPPLFRRFDFNVYVGGGRKEIPSFFSIYWTMKKKRKGIKKERKRVHARERKRERERKIDEED